jgi:hypothetical protein
VLKPFLVNGARLSAPNLTALRHLDFDADTSQILETKLKEMKMKAGESRSKKSSKPE